MAHERKASESASPPGKGRSPIPVAKKDDLEDVSWALSTAEAMWARGDQPEALKWLRRAAESAADAEADDRALELAKAAADVATLLSDRPTAVAMPAPPVPLPTPPPPAVAVSATSNASRPPPPPPARAAASPSITPKPPPVVSSPPPPRVAPSPPKVAAGPSARPPQKGPTPPRVAAPAPVSKRGGRKSSPSMSDEAPATRRASVTNEAKRRARGSRPAADETAPAPSVSGSGALAALHGSDPDQWPTAHLAGDDLDDEHLHTRIGTPAYQESAQKASQRPPPIQEPPPPPAAVAPVAEITAARSAPPPAKMKTSQAVRVVVWRAADGVHVAPAGTTVAAIAVEAMLVALDPSADLAAWLTRK